VWLEWERDRTPVAGSFALGSVCSASRSTAWSGGAGEHHTALFTSSTSRAPRLKTFGPFAFVLLTGSAAAVGCPVAVRVAAARLG